MVVYTRSKGIIIINMIKTVFTCTEDTGAKTKYHESFTSNEEVARRARVLRSRYNSVDMLIVR